MLLKENLNECLVTKFNSQASLKIDKNLLDFIFQFCAVKIKFK